VSRPSRIRSALRGLPRKRALVAGKASPGPAPPAPKEGSLEDVERAYVQRVLERCITLKEAARQLGIDAATLWRMRRRWGLR
jgi:hypothetical protein